MSRRSAKFYDASRSKKYRIMATINNRSSSSSSEEEMDVNEGGSDGPVHVPTRDHGALMNYQEDNRVTDDPITMGESQDRSSSSESEASSYNSVSSIGDSGSGSEVENDSEYEIEDEANKPLFPGALISVAQSVLAILVFALRHKITGVCFADLLKLIMMFCPQPNHCFKTLYSFRKYFVNMKSPLVRHFYCSVCFTKLLSVNSQCNTCCGTSTTSYFLEMPLLHQLQTLYRRPGFYRTLANRFNRRKVVEENFEDIYDGEVYRSLVQNGILQNPSNISLTWNTDGIPLFKSSKFNIWPLYFMINELPYKERTKRENLIVAGIWFGDKKPYANLFLDTFCEPLRKLYRGVNFEVPGIEENILVRGVLICGTCDLPAKALFMNMKQFNGKFGCQKCKIQSTRVDNVSVYPYKAQLELRTTEEAVINARQAFDRKKPVNGVKGPTVLSRICHDFIITTVIDVMHCVYLGLVKRMMTLWFDAAYNGAASSLHEFVKVVDDRIMGLSPPSMVQRIPRKISDIAYWKASELKVWLLYYSIPVLQDLMDASYLDHHKLLVFAISILNQASISMNMINDASRALNEYVAKFENLYGLRNMTCNLHLLLHLPGDVKSFGPLWVTSCFAFEDANGMLKSLVHGTRYAQLQIASTVSMFMNLTELKSKLLIPGSDLEKFCVNLEKSNKRRRKAFRIQYESFVVGKLTKVVCPEVAILNALTGSGIVVRNSIFSFTRLLKNGIFYNSASYARLRKYNSSYVEYEMDGVNHIGILHDFIKISDCACNSLCVNCNENAEFLAILIKCHSINTINTRVSNFTISSIFLCHRLCNEDMIAMPVVQLKSVCFHTEINGELYVIKPVNMTEFE